MNNDKPLTARQLERILLRLVVLIAILAFLVYGYIDWHKTQQRANDAANRASGQVYNCGGTPC